MTPQNVLIKPILKPDRQRLIDDAGQGIKQARDKLMDLMKAVPAMPEFDDYQQELGYIRDDLRSIKKRIARLS